MLGHREALLLSYRQGHPVSDPWQAVSAAHPTMAVPSSPPPGPSSPPPRPAFGTTGDLAPLALGQRAGESSNVGVSRMGLEQIPSLPVFAGAPHSNQCPQQMSHTEYAYIAELRCYEGKLQSLLVRQDGYEERMQSLFARQDGYDHRLQSLFMRQDGIEQRFHELSDTAVRIDQNSKRIDALEKLSSGAAGTSADASKLAEVLEVLTSQARAVEDLDVVVRDELRVSHELAEAAVARASADPVMESMAQQLFRKVAEQGQGIEHLRGLVAELNAKAGNRSSSGPQPAASQHELVDRISSLEESVASMQQQLGTLVAVVRRIRDHAVEALDDRVEASMKDVHERIAGCIAAVHNRVNTLRSHADESMSQPCESAREAQATRSASSSRAASLAVPSLGTDGVIEHIAPPTGLRIRGSNQP